MFSVDWSQAVRVLLRDHRVVAAWAFESAREGVIRPGSDLDVAVLFSSEPTLDDCADLRGALQDALGFAEVDLLVLNRASSLPAFEAVSGRKFCCRDDGACAAFVSEIAREYEDEMAFVENQVRAQFPVPSWDPNHGNRNGELGTESCVSTVSKTSPPGREHVSW